MTHFYQFNCPSLDLLLIPIPYAEIIFEIEKNQRFIRKLRYI
ncbi:MAG: hypothetical protein RL377_391 [Bacteroidota bacterium]|jgi:hypothetical protein